MLASDKIAGATAVPQSFSHRMLAQQPIKTKSGTVRITDSSVFPVSTTIAAALVELAHDGALELLGELHLDAHDGLEDRGLGARVRLSEAHEGRHAERDLR